jgi:hypothetical protein
MSLVDLLIYALVTTAVVIIFNLSFRYALRRWLVNVLVLSVVAYVVVLVMLVYFYSIQII